MNQDFLRAKSANLSGAVLRGVSLKDADLSGADLSGEAKLYEANLSGAALNGAKDISKEQLEQAKSLKDATMPDGQKYEEWLNSREWTGG